MKNFPVIDKNTEREYWISRSIAVVVFLFAKDTFNQEYILAEQRGTGTPDPEYIGKYCVPCGYLDYDETIVQAAQRELMEETGLIIPTSDFKLVNINDLPESDKRQNVFVRVNKENYRYEMNVLKSFPIGFMLPKYEREEEYVDQIDTLETHKTIVLIETVRGLMKIEEVLQPENLEKTIADINCLINYEYYLQSKINAEDVDLYMEYSKLVKE